MTKLKILCEHAPSGPHYVRSGWGRVFAACGHDFRFWQRDGKSAFDAFAEFEPDLFLGTTYGIDRALAKCIKARPALRVALFGSAWGPLVDGVDRRRYPIVVAGEEEKRTLERLKAETGRPDFVFVHVTPRFLEGTMGGWRSIGIEPAGILNAADVFLYYNGARRPEFACDAVFVGSYWPYKARNLDRFLLPLCHPSSGLSVRIFGNSPWPTACCLGRVEDHVVRDLFASASVCPNVSEPHSTDLGFDVIERPFKVLSSGGLCVSDHVEEAREIFDESELPMERTPEGFARLIRSFAEKPQRGESFRQAGRKKVLDSHTYFERVMQMFSLLGLEQHARDVAGAKQSFLEKRPWTTH